MGIQCRVSSAVTQYKSKRKYCFNPSMVYFIWYIWDFFYRAQNFLFFVFERFCQEKFYKIIRMFYIKNLKFRKPCARSNGLKIQYFILRCLNWTDPTRSHLIIDFLPYRYNRLKKMPQISLWLIGLIWNSGCGLMQKSSSRSHFKTDFTTHPKPLWFYWRFKLLEKKSLFNRNLKHINLSSFHIRTFRMVLMCAYSFRICCISARQKCNEQEYLLSLTFGTNKIKQMRIPLKSKPKLGWNTAIKNAVNLFGKYELSEWKL